VEGKAFGRYRLIELLGRGGMGEVWRAFDTETQRTVAVKVLPENLASDPTFEQRFRREALAAAGLTNPHVVPIHHFGEIGGRLYVDMRLITGKDLETLLAQGPLEPERAVKIIEQVASALSDAHRIGLVHRDIKPSNILVSDDDFVYLIDFGIARTAGETRMTSTGNVIGTWAYMAPERLSDDNVDPRADTYALACVLHECLTGSQPFPGDSLEQQIGGHLNSPPPRPSALRSGVPPQLDTVIATGMAKLPEQRYSTVTAMAAAARAAMSTPVRGPVQRTEQLQTHAQWAGRPQPETRWAAATPQPETRWAATPPPETQWAGPTPPAQTYYHPAGGAAPATGDPTQYRPTPSYPSAPPAVPAATTGSAPNNKSRRIALASLGALAVVIAIVAVLAINHHAPDNTKRTAAGAGAGQGTGAVPNTGPFTGTYAATFGPRLLLSGKEMPEAKPPASETWELRSTCGNSGCVATASRMSGPYLHATKLVLDDFGGRWVGVALTTTQCNNRDTEEWNFLWLKPQANGAMAGEWISDALDCYSKRAVTFTRTGDAEVSRLPDPASAGARVVTSALGLRGRYHNTVTFTGGTTRYKPQDNDDSVETVCLRAGDRCISRFVRTDGSYRFELFIYANGAWTRNSQFDAACPAGGTSHVNISIVLPLPNPSADPIVRLSGHGHKEQSGSACTTSDFEQIFSRTGD